MGIKNKIVHVLQIPIEIAEYVPNIEMKGNRELFIENYKSIIEYSDTLIKLRLKKIQLLIEGTELCIEYYTKEDMKITGRINRLQYLESKS